MWSVKSFLPSNNCDRSFKILALVFFFIIVEVVFVLWVLKLNFPEKTSASFQLDQWLLRWHWH